MDIREAALLSAVVLFVVGMSLWSDHVTDQVLKNGETTVCAVYGAGGNNITIVFPLNGTTKHLRKSKPFYTIYDGETFFLKYLPDDIENAEVLFWKPVFDKRLFVETQASSLVEPWTNPHVRFTYTVDGKTFERSQKLNPDRELAMLAEMSVFYKKSDPKISYLLY